MSHPLTNVPASAGPSPLAELTPRQRIETVLSQLPAAGSALSRLANQSPESVAGSLVEPVKRINRVMHQYGVEFHIQEPLSPPVIQITDRETGELIRQIPAEETLQLAERLDELRGRLFNAEV
jgi:flagellar protein FlaG